MYRQETDFWKLDADGRSSSIEGLFLCTRRAHRVRLSTSAAWLAPDSGYRFRSLLLSRPLNVQTNHQCAACEIIIYLQFVLTCVAWNQPCTYQVKVQHVDEIIKNGIVTVVTVRTFHSLLN